MFFNVPRGFEGELRKVSEEMRNLLSGEWEGEGLGGMVKSVLAGRGKGYRPCLLLSAGKFGHEYGSCAGRLYRLGAIVEFVHIASLIHDDIIDDSPLRRGNPTVQAKFGRGRAVFFGDLILGRVMSAILKEGFQESGVLLTEAVQDMCRGEIAQSACRYRSDVTREEYYANIYGKTASMFTAVCKMGAREGGCSDEMEEYLGKIGLHLGYLFQIRDDLLDFLSRGAGEGKAPRMDFKEGILTLPVIFALRHKDYGEELKDLIELSKRGRLTERKLEVLEEIIRASGGFEAAVNEAEKHLKKIEELLAGLPSCEALKDLKLLVGKLSMAELRADLDK